MQSIRLKIAAETQKELERMLRHTEHLGDLRTAKRVMAILAIGDGHIYRVISDVLKVSVESHRMWYRAFLLSLFGFYEGREDELENTV